MLKLDNESTLYDEEPLVLDKIHKKKKLKKISSPKNETKLSPAARKMANEVNIDINKMHGTGKNGVILKEDIMGLMGSKPSPSERKIKHGPEERVKMTRLRLTKQNDLKTLKKMRQCLQLLMK